MKYNLIKLVLLLGIVHLSACCCGGGLGSDQRIATPLVDYVHGDGLLEDFNQSVNGFDH